MPDLRVVMMSILALAMAVALASSPRLPSHMALALSPIDWRHVKPAVTCPSDLPQDCAILWGP